MKPTTGLRLGPGVIACEYRGRRKETEKDPERDTEEGIEEAL
jgi:hypothetical protein